MMIPTFEQAKNTLGKKATEFDINDYIRISKIINDDKNKVVIQIHTKPNSEGKQNISIFWLADNIGYNCNEVGVRGQNFLTDIQERLDNYKRLGIEAIVENKYR